MLLGSLLIVPKPASGFSSIYPCLIHQLQNASNASTLLRMAAKIEKGSGVPNRDKVGIVNRTQVKEIATTKMTDLNASSVEMAMRIVEGTARSMGIDVVEG